MPGCLLIGGGSAAAPAAKLTTVWRVHGPPFQPRVAKGNGLMIWTKACKSVGERLERYPRAMFSAEEFVRAEEAESCALLCELGMLTPEIIDRVCGERGDFLSRLLDLGDVADLMRRHAKEHTELPTFAVGYSLCFSHNGQCHPLPCGEYAIVVDAMLTLSAFRFAELLLQHEAHLYVDIGYPGEDELLIRRATAFADAFAAYLGELASGRNLWPDPQGLLSPSKSPATSTLVPYQMGYQLLLLIAGHEIGHAVEHAKNVREGVKRVPAGDWAARREAELRADLFAYSFFREHSGALPYFDYFFRLSALYAYCVFGPESLGPSTHPTFGARIGGVFERAVEDGIAGPATPGLVNNMMGNLDLWVRTVLTRLEARHSDCLSACRKSWLVGG